MSDSEVITIEAVGTYLGLAQDKALYDYFRCHYGTFFPALMQVDHTTFVRQAAKLWAVKERFLNDQCSSAICLVPTSIVRD